MAGKHSIRNAKRRSQIRTPTVHTVLSIDQWQAAARRSADDVRIFEEFVETGPHGAVLFAREELQGREQLG